MTQASPMETSTPICPLKPQSSNTPANTWKDVGPWNQPELRKDPRQTLDALRENQLALKDLEEKNKRLRSAVEKHYQSGELAEFVDDQNSQKFNYQGLSARLVPGKTKKLWSPEVQSEIEKLEAQILKLEYEAERKHLYTETKGSDYWRMVLSKTS